MAEAMETAVAPPSTGSLFHRRIEFLPSKKQFTGFSKGGGGFWLETLNPTTSDQTKQCVAGSGIGLEMTVGKRTDVAEVTELGLDPEFSFGFTMKRIGAGLENLGNTCFLNSVLQCLTYTEPLAAYLQSGRHKISCRKAGFCALCAIQNHVGRALQATGRSLAPKDLVSNLRCISRNFRNSRQEDAHEYMVNLLESMHKCCLPSGVPSESPSAFEKSLVHKIFGGRLRSQVKCTQCSFCSDKFDPFVDLSLEINKADSLQKALAHFTAKEYLDGGAKEYQCQKCKQKVKALKQLSIHKAPNVLNIHLKRFGCHQPGQKIDKKVQFGTTLDLKPFVTGAYDGDLKYTLYGVLVHYGGSTRSGHYYCFVRTAGGTWYSLDDHRVGNVSEKRVLQEKAYMLFYVRDRKIVTPKKPLDVGHAQSIINAMGNKMQSNNSIQVPKPSFRNVPTERRMDSLHPSPVLAQIDVAVTSALKETLIKGKATEETVGAGSSLEQEVQMNKSSVMPIAKDDGKGISKGSAGSLGDVPFGATSNKIDKCGGARNTNDNPSGLVVASPNSNCLQNSVNKNYSSEVANTPKNNPKEVEKNTSDSLANGIHSTYVDSSIEHNISLKDCDKKGTKTVNPSSQEEEQSQVNIQVGGSSKESINGDCSKEVKLTILESASDPRHRKAHSHKSKKKLKKSQITMTRLNSGVLLRAALSSRKKIKKKVKRSALKINILAQEHLGPSTSELARPVPITVNSKRKRSKPSSKESENKSRAKNEKGSNCDLVEGVTDEKLRDRIGQNAAAVATNMPSQSINNAPSAGIGTVSRECNIPKESRSNPMQNGVVKKLTKGFKETVVARWDETEHPSSQFTGRSAADVIIGHVGDDWDEEIDMGKRKKVRTSVTDFGGPNPFQEVATQKAKYKKAKFHRSSSANRGRR